MTKCAYEKCSKQVEGFPYVCRYCKQKFCIDHRLAEKHECIKTRYVKYVRKSWLRRGGSGEETPRQALNISSGQFYVVCETCGYMGAPSLIEIAGQELESHIRNKGCPDNRAFLEEVG